MIYAVIGWIIEMVVTSSKMKKLANRGFLIGPYCPIYGFGALIMLYVFSKYSYNPVELYIMFVVYASILEYFSSYLMEKTFNARWWDYSQNKFNINGRISLNTSLLFGVAGLIFGYLINPLIVKVLNVIPHNVLYFITIPIFILFLIDVIVTFKIVTKIRKNIVLLNNDMTEDIKDKVTAFLLNHRVIKASPFLHQKIKEFINNGRS